MFRPIHCLFLILFFAQPVMAQESLPNITVTSFNGKVVVSWLNDYDKPLANIFIQRSYDSSINFSTIGSVLIPQNKENGYPDNTPPYDHMYYRISIVFKDGTYVIGPASKPARLLLSPTIADITDTSQKKTEGGIVGLDWPLDEKKVDIEKQTSVKQEKKDQSVTEIKKDDRDRQAELAALQLSNTANMVYVNRYSQLYIQLPKPSSHQYLMRFFDEKDQLLFEINKWPEDGFVLEKYNFRKSGNYSFEIYEDGKLWRKNRFVISKETRKS